MYKKIGFIDVETTGVGVEDRICSVAVLVDDKLYYELINEGKKIPPLASSINNITNEMITDKKSFLESNIYSFLKDCDIDVMIGHNINFDLEMLQRSGWSFDGDIVDTMRCCKHLIDDLEHYGLNFLRYEMKLYKKEDYSRKKYNQTYPLVAHHAPSDVIITQLVYEELLNLASLQELIELSKKPVLLQKFEFGKYAGRYIEEISMCDRGYLKWMLETIEDLDDDLRYTLEYYL